MAAMRQDGPESRQPHDQAVGCLILIPAFLAIVPAAYIGLLGLTDMAPSSPKGWLALAEIFGWVVVCFAIGLLVARLMLRCLAPGPGRFLAGLFAIAIVVAFTWLPHYVGLSAPMTLKRVFTTTLQIVGAAAPIGLCIYALSRRLRHRKGNRPF